MADRYLADLLTPNVLAAQEQFFGHSQSRPEASERDALTEEAQAFIAARDSFYIATISESGWPYVQHRGGAAGFLRVVSPTELAFADYKGNRQLPTPGTLVANQRVPLFLMDYARRERLKILGIARTENARDNPELAGRISEPESRKVVERIFTLEVVSFDWNCPKYITPRYSRAEVDEVIAPLRARIAELEARLAENA